MLAELAEVVRLRGVKCPVSAGPGGFRINTIYNGLKLILNKHASFLSHAFSQDFCEAMFSRKNKFIQSDCFTIRILIFINFFRTLVTFEQNQSN